MKLIELNIGLSSKTQADLNFVEVLNALTGRGFTLITYRVVTSACKDGEEKCLAVKCEAPSDWQTQLATLSDKLGQDCIAAVGFIGRSPYDAFVPSLWVEPEIESSDEFKGWTKETFCSYLQNQIIPDSYASGYAGYADDLETALHFLRKN